MQKTEFGTTCWAPIEFEMMKIIFDQDFSSEEDVYSYLKNLRKFTGSSKEQLFSELGSIGFNVVYFTNKEGRGLSSDANIVYRTIYVLLKTYGKIDHNQYTICVNNLPTKLTAQNQVFNLGFDQSNTASEEETISSLSLQQEIQPDEDEVPLPWPGSETQTGNQSLLLDSGRNEARRARGNRQAQQVQRETTPAQTDSKTLSEKVWQDLLKQSGFTEFFVPAYIYTMIHFALPKLVGMTAGDMQALESWERALVEVPMFLTQAFILAATNINGQEEKGFGGRGGKRKAKLLGKIGVLAFTGVMTHYFSTLELIQSQNPETNTIATFIASLLILGILNGAAEKIHTKWQGNTTQNNQEL